MLINKPSQSMTVGSQGALYVNGKRVGMVHVHRSSDSWSWGEFAAEPDFAEFAPLFGLWSLVMHADQDNIRLSRAASDELRQAEAAIDALRCRMHWPDRDEWTDIYELNVDDKLIEWKHR